jgi:hypothetical protein
VCPPPRSRRPYHPGANTHPSVLYCQARKSLYRYNSGSCNSFHCGNKFIWRNLAFDYDTYNATLWHLSCDGESDDEDARTPSRNGRNLTILLVKLSTSASKGLTFKRQ